MESNALLFLLASQTVIVHPPCDLPSLPPSTPHPVPFHHPSLLSPCPHRLFLAALLFWNLPLPVGCLGGDLFRNVWPRLKPLQRGCAARAASLLLLFPAWSLSKGGGGEKKQVSLFCSVQVDSCLTELLSLLVLTCAFLFCLVVKVGTQLSFPQDESCGSFVN